MRSLRKSELKYSNRFLLMSACLLSLSACSTTPSIKPSVPYQENLLTKCPVKLPRINGVTGKDIAETLLILTPQYSECAARHNQLVDEINQRKEINQ